MTDLLPPIPPAELRAALEAAGFTVESDGEQVAVWRWPAGGGHLVVPAAAGGHYPTLLAAVQEELAEVAARGRAADEVLDAIAGWRPAEEPEEDATP